MNAPHGLPPGAADEAGLPTENIDLFARWRRDLLDWPTPALLADTGFRVVAVNPLAASLGVTPDMSGDAALQALSAVRPATAGQSRAGLAVRVLRVEADDFTGWFIDAPEVGSRGDGVDRTITRRLADSNLRLQEEIRRRRALERQVLSVAESEKRRISLELHDGLGQHLTGLAFLARSLADELKGDQHRFTADADWVVHLLNQAISKTRALARGLWPVNLERESLVASIRRLAEDLEQIYGVSCAVQVVDVPDVASHVAANHVYRIVQEAANNAIKHGRARRLTFRLEAVGDDFAVTVLNDGLAVEAGQIARGKGLGVVGMRLRAESLGGTLSIEPLPAGGTEVTLSLPGIGVDRRGEK